MIFVYLDEFGHGGPFFGRRHTTYSESPVFGLAGIILPENAVRPFASFFLKRKEELLSIEIAKSRKPAYAWEKKGTNLFTPRSITKYPEIRRTVFRIFNRIKECGGNVFYYGREKIYCQTDLNANGLYTTCMGHTIRSLERFAEARKENFVIVIDEHSARKELLETAQKTMYGSNPAYMLASPPFEVESYLNQNAQAADWIATIIGRICAYRVLPGEYADLEPYRDYFSTRMDGILTHSTLFVRNGAMSRLNAERLRSAAPQKIIETVSKTTVIEETIVRQTIVSDPL